MNISVFGLGYVGCVSVGCLAEIGHRMIGVDINPQKVNLLNSGRPTIVEKDIDQLIANNFAKGLISATVDHIKAVLDTEISLICVGTPSTNTGHLNLDYIYSCVRQIAEGLRMKKDFHVIVIRSTVFPGTNEKMGKLIEEITDKRRNIHFSVVSNPEFLREGNAVDDFFHPAITVIGCDHDESFRKIANLYESINAPIIRTGIRSAEMIKYVNNAFHALKITFTNEVGNICKALDIDPYEVMSLFKRDSRLNISTAYFNPGMAYGGSCLPKDLKGLATIAHDHYLKVPVIEAIEYSNSLQHQRVINLVQQYGIKKVGILGLAFKKGTDDLRYSPSVHLAEALIGKGYELLIYDKFVNISLLTGTNKSFIEQHLPHISSLLTNDLKEILNQVQLLIIAHQPEEEEYSLLQSYHGYILDLVRIDRLKIPKAKVEGLSW